MSFFEELRKRNVFRAMAAYLVGAWVMMQVVGFIAAAADMPPWTDTLVLIVVLLGLPIVFVASWALELTPDGIKRTHSADEVEARPFGPMDIVLTVAVVAVVGLFAWQIIVRPAPGPSTSPEPQTQVTAQNRSIAVLPFVAISEEEVDRVLGDGLAEELLNVLAQFPNLSVAGRTSSFAFRDQAEDIQAIGDALNVTHVLEGSVRRVDDNIRVTAQLIRVSDNFHIWSETYDRPFAEINAVQDQIVRSIAQTLTIRLGATAYAVTDQPDVNPTAYEQYLTGRALFAERHVNANRAAAIAAFQTAVDIDPTFADAWAALARAMSYSQAPDGYTEEETCELVQDAAETALQLSPENPEALVAMSDWSYRCARDWLTSKQLVDRAVELAPNAAYTHYAAAIVYEFLGDTEQEARFLRRALALDPLNLTIIDNAAERYLRMERYREALRLVEESDLPAIERLEAQASVATYTRDVEAFEELMPQFAEAFAQFFPVGTLEFELIENVGWSYAAAVRGDREEVEERIPRVRQAADIGIVGEDVIPELYYLLREYRESARLYRIFIEAENWVDPFYQTNRTFDVGLRCQPDYHALWSREGYRDLMAIRRANGATGNLPLDGPECAPFLSGDAPAQE